MVVAYLAVGANEGDRAANIARGIDRLRQAPGLAVEAVSPLHESRAVGGPPQPAFLNGALRVRTSLPAEAVLALCQATERELGRPAEHGRDLPRPLDLDILLFGDQRIDSARLRVPHPRMFEREFVLRPLRELGVDVDALPRPAAPVVLPEAAAFAAQCSQWWRGGCSIGLVPTMGALHAGHVSLVRSARAECDRVAVTIFVNPLQFGAHEDLSVYPRPLAADLDLLRAAGADAVFTPAADGMYGDGFASRVMVGAEAEGMEGAVRPGHFAGVATVVAKLLVLARPTHAYFGEKDAQQLDVIERLVRDLGFPLVVRRCPTVREADGLALSSRNVYLGEADRRAAPVLFRALQAARAAWAGGERDAQALGRIGAAVIATEPLASLDYFEVRGNRAYVAARFAGPASRPTRLIDNLCLAT
ncbi:MAG: pantoate--beta-alanine ligase [Planctomycetota bacterium]